MRYLLLLVAIPALGQPVITSVITASAFGGYPGVAAPASYVEIYGSNLAGSTRTWNAADFNGSLAPTAIDGVTVTVGGIPAFVSYVSPTQVNIEVPDTVPAGGAVPVVVSYKGASSPAAMLTINMLEPGFLTPLSALPVTPGQTVSFYGTGFGPVKQGGVAGRIASGLSSLNAALTITAAGQACVIQYAGLAPGLAGVYQFNVTLPASLPAGTAPVQVTINGVPFTLQTLSLSVKAAGSFTLTSALATDGGALPVAATCDGMGSTIPLAWSNPPAGTEEYAILFSTLPGDGTTKYDWVLYGIPAATTNLIQDTFLVGTVGVGDDGPGQVYDPPCSQGPGAKLYTFTLYALSGPPVFSVPPSQITGHTVASAIANLTLGSAALNLSYSRDPTNAPGSSKACGLVRSSTAASKSGQATVACDGVYAYVSSNGITTAQMMNGITSTNLQVPIPQNFLGANGWKIPLNPAIAAAPTSVLDGPIGVAINGVPIFNPCTQGGCVTGGDTKALGQLDICNGHAGRADDYHYHAAPTCMMADQPANYWDTHPLGWALDGFAIFGYNDADGTVAVRDLICGGNTLPVPNAPAGYAYHVTDSSPYVTNCLIGNPSPDLPNQGAKYQPIRQPPVTPFVDSGMTLTTASDGYQVLQFTSAIPFTTTDNGADAFPNAPGTYSIRYKEVTGTALTTLLAMPQNNRAHACWNFQFVNGVGMTTEPSVSYCK